MNEIVFEPLPEMQDERIDKCISSYLENLSRSYIQKMIKEGMSLSMTRLSSQTTESRWTTA